VSGMMKPTIVTPEWQKKKKKLAQELMRKGKAFFDLQKLKRKRFI
jgi:predicted N-acetyltransferase YhbS